MLCVGYAGLPGYHGATASPAPTVRHHRLAVEDTRTCAVGARGTLACWGRGNVGLLGLGYGVTRAASPTVPTGLEHDVVSVSAGPTETCALTANGNVRCWGQNAWGGVGDGTLTTRWSPTTVTLDGPATDVTVGHGFACAIVNGNVRCWGRNDHGQLGNSANTDSHTPVPVPGLTEAMQLSAGLTHVCAVDAAGSVWCWGQNSVGQVGDGSTLDRDHPVQVTGLTPVTVLQASILSTCVIQSDGAIMCWGINDTGQLGDGGTSGPQSTVPVAVSGSITDAGDIFAGADDFCISRPNSEVWCWGDNTNGVLDDVVTNPFTVPTKSGLMSSVTAYASSFHACVIRSDSTVRCWGMNEADQLGQGSVWGAPTPMTALATPVTSGSLDAGQLHTCVTVSGSARCWGSNLRNQSGGSSTNLWTGAATAVDWALDTPAKTTSGDYFSCLLTTAKTAACWGMGTDGEIGNGASTDRSSPQYVMDPNSPSSVMANIDDIASGGYHACATVSGDLYCWGLNGAGQLGDGTTSGRNLPTNAPVITGVQRASLGEQHSCALKSDGAVWCWGLNASGQLGDGSASNSSSPVSVTLGGVQPLDIDAGFAHTCVVALGGEVWCWGENGSGQLGDGTTTDQTLPVKVSGLGQAATSVHAGVLSTCAVLADHSVKCWGSNQFGNLGDGTTTDRLVPVTVSGVSGAVSVAVGLRHSCADTGGGGVLCWGDNSRGQLGIGTIQVSRALVSVILPVVPAPTTTTSVPSTPETSPPAVTGPTTVPGTQAPAAQVTQTTTATSTAARTRTLKVGRFLTVSRMVSMVSLSVPKGSVVTVTVKRSSARVCSVIAKRLKGQKTGTCRIRLVVTAGKRTVRSLSTTITVVR